MFGAGSFPLLYQLLLEVLSKISPQIYPPIKSSPGQLCLVLNSLHSFFHLPLPLNVRKLQACCKQSTVVGSRVPSHSLPQLFVCSCSRLRGKLKCMGACMCMCYETSINFSHKPFHSFLQLADHVCIPAMSSGSPLYNEVEIYWFLNTGALPTYLPAPLSDRHMACDEFF